MPAISNSRIAAQTTGAGISHQLINSSISTGSSDKSCASFWRQRSTAVRSIVWRIMSVHLNCVGGILTAGWRLTHSITSATFCTNVAPSRISRLQPSDRGSSGDPGTAITSLPRVAASLAVISEPDRCAASATTTPTTRLAITRCRMGKCLGVGFVAGGISASSSPRDATSSNRSAFYGG